jgi:mRNA interferase MazF
MKRAEIWTVAATASSTICPLTSLVVDAPLIRLPIAPTKQNGVQAVSHVIVDKITTVAKSTLQKRVGKLADDDRVRINRAVVMFLGVAGRPGV